MTTHTETQITPQNFRSHAVQLILDTVRPVDIEELDYISLSTLRILAKDDTHNLTRGKIRDLDKLVAYLKSDYEHTVHLSNIGRSSRVGPPTTWHGTDHRGETIVDDRNFITKILYHLDKPFESLHLLNTSPHSEDPDHNDSQLFNLGYDVWGTPVNVKSITGQYLEPDEDKERYITSCAVRAKKWYVLPRHTSHAGPYAYSLGRLHKGRGATMSRLGNITFASTLRGYLKIDRTLLFAEQITAGIMALARSRDGDLLLLAKELELRSHVNFISVLKDINTKLGADVTLSHVVGSLRHLDTSALHVSPTYVALRGTFDKVVSAIDAYFVHMNNNFYSSIFVPPYDAAGRESIASLRTELSHEPFPDLDDIILPGTGGVIYNIPPALNDVKALLKENYPGRILIAFTPEEDIFTDICMWDNAVLIRTDTNTRRPDYKYHLVTNPKNSENKETTL